MKKLLPVLALCITALMVGCNNSPNIDYTVISKDDLGLYVKYRVTTTDEYGRDSLEQIVTSIKESAPNNKIFILFYVSGSNHAFGNYAYYDGQNGNGELFTTPYEQKLERTVVNSDETNSTKKKNPFDYTIVTIGIWSFHDASMGVFREELEYNKDTKEFYFNSHVPKDIYQKTIITSVKKYGSSYIIKTKYNDNYRLSSDGKMVWKCKGYADISAKCPIYKAELMDKCYKHKK